MVERYMMPIQRCHPERSRGIWSVAAIALAALVMVSQAQAQPYTLTTSDIREAYQARVDSVIDYYAYAVPEDDLTRGGYLHIAARLFRGDGIDWAAARLDTLMQDPRGDMFWMYPFITVTYAGRDVLPSETKAKMRDLWRTYMPYRGDTENHWAMYYSALYLICQMYPDDPAETWYTGKSAQENMAEAKEYLLSWMELATTIGQGEYDSPDYFEVYIVPMSQLYAWAEDPEMKLRAGMMLDWLIADMAIENLNGLYTGGHSRVYPRQVKEQWYSGSTGIAWLLFGDVPFKPRGQGAILAMSGYTPHEIIYRIGTDRSKPYTNREYKRTRHRIRFSDLKNAPVYKTGYMRSEYAVGSTQGGLLQPIQQQTWDVTWAVDDPRGVHNTLFTIQPHSSTTELGMYFAEYLGLITELVVRSKTTYDSIDKWTGGSPYEHVAQYEDAVIALYDIDPEAKYPEISGFFSKDLSVREEDDSGWIFARGGDAFMAYYPLQPYDWEPDEDQGDWRLRSKFAKNGAVVQVAPASDFASWDAFKDAVRALPIQTAVEPTPSVTFTSLRGATFDFTYGETPIINGKLLDLDNWPLFDNPFMKAERGSRKLELRYGKTRRLLDFENLVVKDWIEEQG